MKILSIDVGGSSVKVLAIGHTEPRTFRSGKALTPPELVSGVRRVAAEWEYDAVSIGVPAVVGDHGPREEPGNLGPGWVGFDFAAAFERPVKIVNDATMQALGSYTGGRMLFLGLGTGVGSTLIAENVIVPLELGELPYRGKTIHDYLGRIALRRIGKTRWRTEVARVTEMLLRAFVADYIVLGGGNANEVRELPAGVRVGHNQSAFRGGYRLWGMDIVPTHETDGLPLQTESRAAEWRLI